MNDRLKFRVWSKEHKKYYYIDKDNFDKYTDIVKEWVEDWETGEEEAIYYSYGKLLFADDDNFVKEFYSGTQDKNGKPIFEGDILQRMVQPYNQMGYKENYEVKELGYYLPQGETYGIFCVNLWGTDCEVIGNMNENPELIGGK